MISELNDIGMYSEELMTRSRKRRDVKKKEAYDLELKHAQKVFYCNTYIYICASFTCTQKYTYIFYKETGRFHNIYVVGLSFDNYLRHKSQ